MVTTSSSPRRARLRRDLEGFEIQSCLTDNTDLAIQLL